MTPLIALNNIGVGPFTLAVGVLNAHSSPWNEPQPAGQRGELVEDWRIFRNARILNNNEPTPSSTVNQAIGGLSTRDIDTVSHQTHVLRQSTFFS